jgi:hypothetical protein
LVRSRRVLHRGYWFHWVLPVQVSLVRKLADNFTQSLASKNRPTIA